jgi:MoaA/NifB/PqqE/SkfB family radical SAM enzyme
MNRDTIKKPGFCCLGIVDTCMLHCKMCDKWKEDLVARGNTEATTAQYKTFLKNLREIVDDNFEIDIGGGEALMRDDVLELVRYMKDLGFRTTIASNGFIINEAMADRIVASGLSSLILSIDSLKPEVHDAMRGVKGVQKQVMRAIDLVRARSKDIHIGLCSIIMDATLDGVIDLANWSNARRDTINSHLFMAVMQPNNTVSQDEWFESEALGSIWPKDIARARAVVDELIVRRKRGDWIGNSVEQLEAFKMYFENPTRFVKKSSCNLDRALHVSAVGDIFLCFKWGILGNIKRGDDIRELWYSEAAEKIRENIRHCNDNCHYLLNCFFEGDYPFIVDNKNSNT